METKYNIVAICGKAGAGKDSILKEIENICGDKINKIISCTTRPPREGEIDGIDYYFLTKEQFARAVLDGGLLEATQFNGWWYGTLVSALDADKWNVGVFNPSGIECLLQEKNINLKTYYIYAPDKIRLLRQLTREDDPNVPEIIRRYQTDEQNFIKLGYCVDFIKLTNLAIGDQTNCANKIIKDLSLI